MARAVLTRDPSEIDAYAVALAAIGIEVVAMPITRAAPARDPDALGRALTGDFAAIVIASARAARELARVAGSHALPEIWAVGPATRQALELAGLPARHPDHVRDGTELAAALIASRTLAGKRVLVPRAEEGRVEALELLRNAGAEVVDVIAYRTIATPADDPGDRTRRVAAARRRGRCVRRVRTVAGRRTSPHSSRSRSWRYRSARSARPPQRHCARPASSRWPSPIRRRPRE